MNARRFILSVLILCVALLPALSLAETDSTVTVVGTAVFTVEADTAVLNIGVQSSAPEASAASRQNANDVAAVTAALIEAGIPEADIHTNYYYVSAIYRYSEGMDGDRIAGYQVNNSLSVKVRDISRVGEIIDIALSSGANSCDGISFSSSGEDLNNEALAAAVREARRKAEIVAEAAGMKLGRVLSVTENASSYAGVQYARAKGAAMETVEEADAGTSITPGGLTFSASVTVTFEMED